MELSGTPVTPAGLIFTTTSYELARSRLNVAPAGWADLLLRVPDQPLPTVPLDN